MSSRKAALALLPLFDRSRDRRTRAMVDKKILPRLSRNMLESSFFLSFDLLSLPSELFSDVLDWSLDDDCGVAATVERRLPLNLRACLSLCALLDNRGTNNDVMPRLAYPYFGIRCWRAMFSYLLLALLLVSDNDVDGRNHGFRHVDVRRYMMIWILRMSSIIDLRLALQHVLLIKRLRYQ